MIIPFFFYAQCDPIFQCNVLDKLENAFNQAEELHGEEYTEEKALLITDFIHEYADQYLIPREYWVRWRDCLIGEVEGDLYTEKWDEEKVMDHFIHFHGEDASYEKTDFSYYLMHTEHNGTELSFPHDNTEWTLNEYIKNETTHHPSKKELEKYERMTKLYAQIKAAENDTEKWFNLVRGVNIDQFLRANVECRLGNNLLDKQLWKLYIAYLKEIDPKAMLVVYSKYVRFFMDDQEMIREYEQRTRKYGPVELFWENCFDFEDDDEYDDDESDSDGMDEDVNNGNEAHSEKMDVSVAVPPFNRQICATFFNNVYRQNGLTFHQPTIDFLLKHAPPAILQKLFKCGKYCFARKPTPICYRLKIHGRATMFNEECVTLNIADKNLLKNVHIATTLQVPYYHWRDEPLTETFKNYTSTLIPLLSRCDAKFIKMGYQNLSFKELKFLIERGNCVELELPNCEIKDGNGEYVDLEEIMKFLPNIKKLKFPTVKVNSNTAHALCAQKFVGKFERIVVKKIIGKPFHAEEFKNFIVTRRRARHIVVKLYFDKNFDASFVSHLWYILFKYEEICNDETRFRIEKIK